MRLENAALVDELARRYVLGTLRGPARRRLQSRAQSDFRLRRAIEAWEERLAALAWSLPPETPSDLTWPRVAGLLGFAQAQPGRRQGAWAAVAAAFAMLAIVMTVGWWQSTQVPPQVVTETVVETVREEIAVALVEGEDGNAIWLASLRPQTAVIDVRVLNAPEPRPDADYQLWLLGEDGTPISLGLLPQSGAVRLSMDQAAIAALADSELVAVSLEPPGGSPETVPTGPVLFTAALLVP